MQINSLIIELGWKKNAQVSEYKSRRIYGSVLGFFLGRVQQRDLKMSVIYELSGIILGVSTELWLTSLYILLSQRER